VRLGVDLLNKSVGSPAFRPASLYSIRIARRLVDPSLPVPNEKPTTRAPGCCAHSAAVNHCGVKNSVERGIWSTVVGRDGRTRSSAACPVSRASCAPT
jgi:hypothetical protein